MIAARLHRKLRRLLANEPPEQAGVRAVVAALGPAPAGGTGPLIAVQCVEDVFYLGLFATVAGAVRDRSAGADLPRFDLVVTRSFEAGLFAGWGSLLKHALLINRLISRDWLAAYRVIGPRVAYRSHSARPLADLADLLAAWRAWRAWVARPDHQRADVAGIECGDLVIDSYLRFRPSPRFVAGDLFVLVLLWQAHRDVRRARAYFGRARPQCYLTSYTTYVQHGVATRVALQAGVRVVSFGNYQEFGKWLSTADSFHTRCPLHYRRDFQALPDGPAKLLQAARQLEQRLSGGIDSATLYMAASAYRSTGAEVPDVRGAVVVFLHDFYDSPHVYADLVFADFWDWICFTIDTLKAAGQPFWLKPHPNQVALSDAVIGELRQRYPGLNLVPPKVTNRELVDAGMACAVTVYGTVAHEMAYLGVHSIGCARHPHIAYDFCRTARDREGYAALLRQARQAHLDAATLRAQAVEFYVMHNLSLPDDERALRDALAAQRLRCGRPETPPDDLAAGFRALAAEPALARFAQALRAVPAEEPA